MLPSLPADCLTAALGLLGLAWPGTPCWQPHWCGCCLAPAECLWPPPVETSSLGGKPARHQQMSWDEVEGCHYNSKTVYVQLPSILQTQSQELSFPLPGQPAWLRRRRGTAWLHCEIWLLSQFESITGLHRGQETGTTHGFWIAAALKRGCRWLLADGPFPHPAAPDFRSDSWTFRHLKLLLRALQQGLNRSGPPSF